jgi:Ribonuclease G/E
MAREQIELKLDTAPMRQLLADIRKAIGNVDQLKRIGDALEKLANPPEVITADFLEAKPADTRTVEALERIADALELGNLDSFVSATSHPGLFDAVRRMVRASIDEQSRRRFS